MAVIKAKHYGETEARLAQDPIVIAMAHGLADVPRSELVHDTSDVSDTHVTPRFEFMQKANAEYRARGGQDGGHIGAVAHALLMVLDSGEVKPTKVVTYSASRSSMNARSDEDAAMAHAAIASGDDLEKVRKALVDYMVNEAGYILQASDSPWASERANAIMDQVKAVFVAKFPGENAWESQSFEADGIRFQLVRVEKKGG